MRRGNGQLILVVDDEASMRLVTKKIFERFGYRVILADDGSEAVIIFAIRDKEIDLVLIDMVMPVLDGPATIQILRKMKPEQRIIVTSGNATEDQFLRATGLDAKYFLAKPFTAQQLLSKVAEVLDPR